MTKSMCKHSGGQKPAGEHTVLFIRVHLREVQGQTYVITWGIAEATQTAKTIPYGPCVITKFSCN